MLREGAHLDVSARYYHFLRRTGFNRTDLNIMEATEIYLEQIWRIFCLYICTLEILSPAGKRLFLASPVFGLSSLPQLCFGERDRNPLHYFCRRLNIISKLCLIMLATLLCRWSFKEVMNQAKNIKRESSREARRSTVLFLSVSGWFHIIS